MNLDLKKNLLKIGHTTYKKEKEIISYMRSKQCNSFVPLKCVGIIEGNRNDEQDLHKIESNKLHHGLEIFWYQSKFINTYIKPFMSDKNIQLMNQINKELMEVWNNDKEKLFECENCHRTFLLRGLKIHKKKCVNNSIKS